MNLEKCGNVCDFWEGGHVTLEKKLTGSRIMRFQTKRCERRQSATP